MEKQHRAETECRRVKAATTVSCSTSSCKQWEPKLGWWKLPNTLFMNCSAHVLSPHPHPSTPPSPFNERDYEITGILKLPITTAPGCFIKTKSHHSRTQQCAVAYFSCRVHLPPKDKEKATDENHLHFQARFRAEKMNTKRPNFPRRSSSYPHSHPGSFPRKALQE